jgi:hypothetical protein
MSEQLDAFRQKFPIYKDVPDEELADRLYEKYYDGKISQKDYYAQVGVDAPSYSLDVAKSIGRGLKRGVVDVAGFPGAVAGLIQEGVESGEEALADVLPEQLGQNLRRAAAGHRAEETDIASPEWINRKLGLEYGRARTMPGKFAEAIAENVPAFALPEELLVSKIRPGVKAARGVKALTKSAGTRAAGAAGAGVGEEAAGELSDDDPLARAVGGIAGGGLAGVSGVRAAYKERRARLATAEETKEDAQKSFKILDRSQHPIDEMDMAMGGAAIDAALRRDGYRPETAPKTFSILDRDVTNRSGGYSTSRVRRTVGDLVATHEALGKVKPSQVTGAEDAEAANIVREHIRAFLDRQVPGLGAVHKRALRSWGAGAKADELNTALDIAEHRAKSTGTGANIDNTIRQEVRKIRDNPSRMRGYTPEQADQMSRVVEGTLFRNLMRFVGRFAPTGLHSSAPTLVAWLLNSNLAIAGAATAFSAKKIGDFMTKHEVEKLVDSVLAGAPINKAKAARQATHIARAQLAGKASAARGGAVGYESGLQRGPGNKAAPGEALNMREFNPIGSAQAAEDKPPATEPGKYSPEEALNPMPGTAGMAAKNPIAFIRRARQEGKPWQEIADAVGVSRSKARRLVGEGETRKGPERSVGTGLVGRGRPPSPDLWDIGKRQQLTPIPRQGDTMLPPAGTQLKQTPEGYPYFDPGPEEDMGPLSVLDNPSGIPIT